MIDIFVILENHFFLNVNLQYGDLIFFFLLLFFQCKKSFGVNAVEMFNLALTQPPVALVGPEGWRLNFSI